MSLDQLISASFRDLADEADLSVMPTDIADAALHRRARQRTARVMTASAAVVAVAAAIAVPTIVMDQSPISTGRASPSQPFVTNGEEHLGEASAQPRPHRQHVDIRASERGAAGASHRGR
jgi:hypothetical protein